MHAFTLETRISAPIERCFSLSLSVDAHTSSMSQSQERAVGGVKEGEMTFGDVVTWRGRHFGVPFHLTSKITEYSRLTWFVDEQVAGPFKYWWHSHEFIADGDATRMVDHVRFAAPLGLLGRLAEKFVLARYMEKLIVKRNDWLKQELER